MPISKYRKTKMFRYPQNKLKPPRYGERKQD